MKKAKLLLPLISGLLLTQGAQANFFKDFIRGGKPAPRQQQQPRTQPRPQPQPQPRYDDNYDEPRYDDFGTPYDDNYNLPPLDIGNYQDDEIKPASPQVDPENMTAAEKDKNREKVFFQQPNYKMPIRIVKTEWSAQDERNFDQFVSRIGFAVRDGKCSSVQTCMKDPSVNPYADSDPSQLILYSDCADFPYFLRTYFAYKNGLPFSYAIDLQVSPRPYASAADSDKELDMSRQDKSPYGNIILNRGNSNVPKQPGSEKNFLSYLFNTLNTVSTRTFRVGPLTPGAELSDVYPVTIDRNGIRPGSVIHTTGHMYMIYNVDENGTVFLVDAHPGGWLQADKDKFLKPSLLDRSRPDQGLGIFRFRNQRLVGAKNINGYLYGGRVVTASNQELIDSRQYSLEQYFGVGTNIVPGMQVDSMMYRQAFKGLGFFDYVKMRLSGHDIILQADKEIKNLMSSLCKEMQERMKDVNHAIEDNIHRKSHPSVLPSNIYSASGDWEDYSSPSRDSRMKASVVDIMSSSVTKYRLAKAGGYKLEFKGSAQDYQASMLNALADLNNTCSISYTKSNGQKQSLSYTQVLSRLSKLSFDPYHCPERRWGATGEEAASCRDTDSSGQWYSAEQGIRNTTSKLLPDGRLAVRSTQDISLDMLMDSSLMDQGEGSATNLGTTRVPYSNLKEYFSSPMFLNSLR